MRGPPEQLRNSWAKVLAKPSAPSAAPVRALAAMTRARTQKGMHKTFVKPQRRGEHLIIACDVDEAAK